MPHPRLETSPKASVQLTGLRWYAYMTFIVTVSVCIDSLVLHYTASKYYTQHSHSRDNALHLWAYVGHAERGLLEILVVGEVSGWRHVTAVIHRVISVVLWINLMEPW